MASINNKRSRADLERELTEAKEEKHRAQKRARLLKRELRTLTEAEAKARAVKVSWRALLTHGGNSRTAWKKVTSASELRVYKEHGCIEAFYSNYRSGGAEELFKLSFLGANNKGNPFYVYVCDQCFADREDLLDEYEGPHEWVFIDPNDYEPERVKAMLEFEEDDEDEES